MSAQPPEFETLELETAAGRVVADAAGPADGPLVLALHGYGKTASSAGWRYLLEPLGGMDCRVVAISMPGFGSSPGLRHPSRAEYALLPGGPASIVLDVVMQLGRGIAVLVGYDWGAAVALAVAVHEPAAVAGLVLFHSPYTEGAFPFSQLDAVGAPALLLWVTVEQNHPVSHGHALAKAIRGAELQVFRCGPYSAEKPRNNYEVIAADVSRAIASFLERVFLKEEDVVLAAQAASRGRDGPAGGSVTGGFAELQAPAMEASGGAAGAELHTAAEPFEAPSDVGVSSAAPARELASAHAQPTVLEHGAAPYANSRACGAAEPGTPAEVGDSAGVVDAELNAATASVASAEVRKAPPEAAQGSATSVSEAASPHTGPAALGRGPASGAVNAGFGQAAAKGPGRKRKWQRQAPALGRLQWGFNPHDQRTPAEIDPEGHGVIEPAGELRHVATRGGEVVVQVLGPEQGRPIVVLHGWGRCSWSRDLQCLFGPLADLGYRVIAPDQPGFGRSRGRRWGSRSETNCDDGGPVQVVEDVLSGVGVGAAASLDVIGWSWGGGIAVSFVLQHVARVGRLVLWQGSYTDHKGELRTLKPPSLVIWVPVDQVHPVSLGRHYKDELPRCDYVEVGVGKFAPEKCRHCYEACRDKVVPVITGWLRRFLRA